MECTENRPKYRCQRPKYESTSVDTLFKLISLFPLFIIGLIKVMENLKGEQGQGTGSAAPKLKKQMQKDPKLKDLKSLTQEELDPQGIRREAIMQW